jgi:hypothetical protein
MKFAKLATFFAVLAVLFMHTALGDEGLKARADSLKDSLRDLKNLFAGRDASFRASTSAIFTLIDRARSSAEDVQKLAGKGAAGPEVGGAVLALRDRMERMQGFISQIRLTDQERAVYRNVNVRYSQVLKANEIYQMASGTPGYR